VGSDANIDKETSAGTVILKDQEREGEWRKVVNEYTFTNSNSREKLIIRSFVSTEGNVTKS
jgi:hypothetical protein